MSLYHLQVCFNKGAKNYHNNNNDNDKDKDKDNNNKKSCTAAFQPHDDITTLDCDFF